MAEIEGLQHEDPQYRLTPSPSMNRVRSAAGMCANRCHSDAATYVRLRACLHSGWGLRCIPAAADTLFWCDMCKVALRHASVKTWPINALFI